MAIAVADVLRSRSASVDVALHDRDRPGAPAEGTTEIVIDFVAADGDRYPVDALREDALLAAVTLGFVLAVPDDDTNPSDAGRDLRTRLTEIAPGPGRSIVTEIPALERTPAVTALQEATGVTVPDEAFVQAHELAFRRDMLRTGRAVAALLTTTDPTLHGMPHSTWPIPTETTHRIVLQPTGAATADVDVLRALLDGLTAEVMRELSDLIGQDVLQGARDPAIPPAVSGITRRILRAAT